MYLAPERAAITALLSGAVDLEQVVARTVRALAQLTGQLAVVDQPGQRVDGPPQVRRRGGDQ